MEILYMEIAVKNDMEISTENSIPQIFKIQLLWKILPYYGSLTWWMLLMKKLNKKTEKIWEDNEKEFLIVGKESKTVAKKWSKDLLKLLNLNVAIEYFQSFEFNKDLLEPIIDAFIQLIDNGLTIHIMQSHKSCNRLLSFYSKDDIQNVFLNRSDPSYKFFKTKCNSKCIIANANHWLKSTGAVILNKKENKIEIRSVPWNVLFPQDYEILENNLIELREDHFKITKGWDPTTIVADSICSKINKVLNYVKSIHNIIIVNDILKFDIKRMKSMLHFLKSNRNTMISFSIFNFEGMSDKLSLLKIYTNVLIFVIDGIQIPVEIDKNFIELNWSIIDIVNKWKNEFMFISLRYMKSEKLRIQYMQESIETLSNELSYLWKRHKDDKLINAFIRIKDINGIESKYYKKFRLSKIKLPIKMIMYFDWSNISQENIIQIMSRLPKHIKIYIKNL